MTAPWNGRPPAPLDERDGRHELRFWSGDVGAYAEVYEWRAATGQWFTVEEGGGLILEEFGFASAEYGAAVLTPDQISAQIAEAVKAERDACAEACEALELLRRDAGMMGAVSCASAIRARGETK